MTDGGLGATVQGEVGERYRVLGSLGTGGSGETFEAVRASDGLPVALKRLVVAKTREWKTIELFEREARVLAGLAHPGIPVFRESFVVESSAGTCLYLASDLAPGRSLRAWMDAGWRADPGEVLRITEFLLGVLAYLHSLSPPVIHRDIKPDNIIRGDDGRLFLVDFGAVRDFSTTMGGSSTVVGTYGYMAPEQFRGQAVPASDVYAVAATLLHLMTGRSPHELPQAKLKVVFRPHVQAPPALLAWLDRALEPSPEDRFATAAEALDALRRGVVPKAAGARTRTPRGRVALLVSLLALIGAGAGAFVIRDVRASRARSGLLLNGATAPLPRLPIRPAGAYEPVRYVRTLDGHMTNVLGLALSPDGKTLASSSEGSVKLWNAATGDVVRTLQGHVGKVGGVVFTNDAKQLVTGDSTTIRLFDVATGAQVRTIEHPHAASVMDLALSLDGKTLFTAGRDGVAKSWDLESGRELHAYAHGAPLYRIGLSPNGVHLVTGAADGTVQVWDARTATRISAWNAHAKKNVNDIAFAPDGTLLATAGDDNVAKVSLFTGRGTLTPRYTIDFTDEAWGVQFSPDGRFLVATSKDQALQVSEALDGTMVARLDAGESTGKVVFSKDSRSMFVTSAAYVQSYRLPYRNSGTTLPVPPESASDQLPKAKNKAHGLYLEAMSLMLRWPATPLDEAKAKLDEAVASDAKSQVAWVGYAQLAVKRGFRDGGGYAKESLDEARKHLEHAASLGPKGAEYWSVTAWVARAANDPAVTRNAVREAYAVVPDEPYAVLADADLANREGRHAAGLELASRVARSTRRVDLQTWAHQFLADSYTGLGDIDAADAAHKKQIELAPQNAWKRANYAYFLLHVAGDPQRAIEEAETGRAMMDHFGAARTLAEAHIEKGHRFLWGAGDAARARAEYDAALAIEKRWPAALYGRAACWRALAISEHDPSLVKRAREDLTAALALSPKFTLARKAMDELDRVTAAAKSK